MWKREILSDLLSCSRDTNATNKSIMMVITSFTYVGVEYQHYSQEKKTSVGTSNSSLITQLISEYCEYFCLNVTFIVTVERGVVKMLRCENVRDGHVVPIYV